MYAFVMSCEPAKIPPFEPLKYVAPAVAFAAFRVAMEMQNALWLIIFGVLTVAVGGFVLRKTPEFSVFAVREHSEDFADQKPTGIAIAFAASIFMDIAGDSFVPAFDLSPDVRMYGLFGIWSVIMSLGFIADARRSHQTVKNRVNRVLGEPARALPGPASDVESEAMRELRDCGVTGGWRMKMKTLASRIDADPDEVVDACKNMEQRGAARISTIGYKNKPHEWNVELTASGLKQAFTGPGTRS